jgi:hypothetical protein
MDERTLRLLTRKNGDMKINGEKHRFDLIAMYEGIKNDPDSTRFEKLLFENAVHKLKNDCTPRKVEDWVVACEKLWRKSVK